MSPIPPGTRDANNAPGTSAIPAATQAGRALRRWLAQPHLDVAPGWFQCGAPGRSPLRANLASARLRSMLPAPYYDINALQHWHPWLARPVEDIEADLIRAAALTLQRQIRQCIHGNQRLALIDALGASIYQEVMRTHGPALQPLEGLLLPEPQWAQRQQVLACGLRLAYDVLHRASPYLAQRLLLRFPPDIVLPPVDDRKWSQAACMLASTILQQKDTHDDH